MDKEIYRQNLVQIFRDDIYNELINFWCTVEESKYDFKIFVSKKCFVLYKVFLPMLDFKSYASCVKITDTAIPMYLNSFRNKTVLIIDDVLIHGRTAIKISEQVAKRAKKVDFFVFAKNDSITEAQDTSTRDMATQEKCILSYAEKINKARFEMQEKLITRFVECSEYQWKRISDLIIKSFWHFNMPYVSYLPIVTMQENGRLFDNQQVFSNIYNSHRQIDLKQSFSYCVKSTTEKNGSNAIIHYCFIASKNDFVNDTKIIPMVFFDCENTNIDKRFIIKSIEIIYGKKGNALLEYFKIKDQNKQRKKNNIYSGLLPLLKFLIFSVGYLAVKVWLTELGFKETEYYFELSNAKYSFGIEIEKFISVLKDANAKSLLENVEQEPIKNLNVKGQNKNLYLEEQNYLLSGLRDSYLNMKECRIKKHSPELIDIFYRYFKFNNIYDEKCVCQFKGKEFVRGLNFSEIKNYLLEKDYSVDEIIKALAYHYNLGIAAIDFVYDYDYEDNIIGINMYWRSGEQSYKCISQTYVPIVYFQNMYNDLFGRKVAKFLCERYVEVAENNYSINNIPFSKIDLEKYCSIKDNVYNYFDIERYANHEEYKYLCYIGKELQQYAIRGYIQENLLNDVSGFYRSFLMFLKKRTEQHTAICCEKILSFERNNDINNQ